MPSEWEIKKQICDVGRRLYARQFAAGNDGNISCRLSDNVVVCTPTQICKGFMKPDDLCTVDLSGKHIFGKRPRTSEVLLHLEIYRADPAVRAVVHCHPPHATAFGLAGIDIPTCILPEVEVFLGVVPRAEYETPGSESFAQTVRPFVGKANTVILSNHGTVSWGLSVERAYWHTEMLDSYCRMLMLACQIGGVRRLPESKVNELLDLKEQFGAGVDPRRLFGGELCVNTGFGREDAGAPRDSEAEPGTAPEGSTDFEALVREVTARVMDALRNGDLE